MISKWYCHNLNVVFLKSTADIHFDNQRTIYTLRMTDKLRKSISDIESFCKCYSNLIQVTLKPDKLAIIQQTNNHLNI